MKNYKLLKSYPKTSHLKIEFLNKFHLFKIMKLHWLNPSLYKQFKIYKK